MKNNAKKEAAEIISFFVVNAYVINPSQAKKCALIAVDEKINTARKFYHELDYPVNVTGDNGYLRFKKELEYLQELREQINIWKP